MLPEKFRFCPNFLSLERNCPSYPPARPARFTDVKCVTEKVANLNVNLNLLNLREITEIKFFYFKLGRRIEFKISLGRSKNKSILK